MYAADFKWPDDANIAVVFNMSWETLPRSYGTPESDQKARQRPPADAKYARGMRWIYENAFAETGGMQRLLDLWRRFDIRTSIYCDGLTVELYPELARQAVADGHEFLVQGWDHSFLWGMTPEEQAENIDRTIDAFDRVLGIRATGFSCAGGHLTPETFPIIAERGFVYSCGLRNAEVPFIIPVGDKKLVGMTSYDVSDTRSMTGSDRTPREVIEIWRDFFDQLYDEGARGFPKMLAYGTHPPLAMAYRIRPLEELLDYVKSKPKVWITTRGEIAQWMLDHYPEHDLSKFYPEAVASDRFYGLFIGLGGAEAEAEARRHRRG